MRDDRPPGDPIPPDARAVVLVEGPSDAGAVTVAATIVDVPLGRAAVVSMGGITNIGWYLRACARAGLATFGLYDVAAAGHVGRALRAVDRDRLGRPADAEVGDALGLPGRGFFACDVDLEDELIRALGTERVEHFVRDSDEASTWAIFCRQPAQRERSLHDRLHRFAGIRSGRKFRYGTELTALCSADRVPPPLRELVRAVGG